MTARTRAVVLTVLVMLLAGALRGAWLTADPPSVADAGIVWHDEGAWVHNARNQALWGVWRTDAWNPVFIAPVFTALEYVVFETVGVGTWQARMVPLFSGLLAIMALMAGLRASGGTRVALLGGLLLATNFTFVMWNRAALMESTMTACIVVSWAAYAMATRGDSPPRTWVWGLLTGVAAVAAFFTKAAAAFFLAALLIEMATAWWVSRHTRKTWIASLSILVGLCVATVVVLVVFVIPHWEEFRFYNWEMSVTRKPSYHLTDFQNRVTFLLAHGVFSRMWLVLAAAAIATLTTVRRWTAARPAARLAVLWLIIGLLELVIHDSGNERRYVMLIPALIALAAMMASRRIASAESDRNGDMVPVALLSIPLAYLLAGSLLRVIWIDEIRLNEFTRTVMASAGFAICAGTCTWIYRKPLNAWLSRWVPGATAVVVTMFITVGADLAFYTRWAHARTFFNYEASRQLAGLLPPGTLVHGKLANGLSLENQIVPLFVGRGFGNYADRLERNDARYILSYTLPEPGYEGDVILEVLRHYPQRRVLTEFEVQETPGPDRAALTIKFPDGPDRRAPDK